MRLLSDGSAYLFPQRRRGPRYRYLHVSPCTLNAALNEVPHGLPPFTVHDLRRTARTKLSALKVSTEVAERCLGHKLPGIQGTYDIHDYYQERREALTLWTAVLVDAFSGEGKVVPFRQPLVAHAVNSRNAPSVTPPARSYFALLRQRPETAQDVSLTQVRPISPG